MHTKTSKLHTSLVCLTAGFSRNCPRHQKLLCHPSGCPIPGKMHRPLIDSLLVTSIIGAPFQLSKPSNHHVRSFTVCSSNFKTSSQLFLDFNKLYDFYSRILQGNTALAMAIHWPRILARARACICEHANTCFMSFWNISTWSGGTWIVGISLYLS